jgi:cytochrome c553
MKPLTRGIAIAAGLVAALAALVPGIIYLRSEALVVRRYTLPSSVIEAAKTDEERRWGKHVAMVYGCSDCHGAAMTGRMEMIPPGLTLAAPNLRRFAASYPDGDFDWAVRRGLSPSARALWVMPSASYVYMRDTDLADILGWLRTLPVKGPDWPEPQFSFRARLAILAGGLKPVDPYDLGRSPPRDVGPRYDGGRYLAAMACSSCHGTDLKGSGRAPDLSVVSAYSRLRFFALMRHGQVPAGRHAPRMALLSRTRFSEFKDYEIDALYAYLTERARTAPLAR